MQKKVFMLPVSFTGSYTEDKPKFYSSKVSCIDKVVNFKDFAKPNGEIRYFSRT